MKLYHTPGGHWSGTEKDWKAAMKAEGRDPKTATIKTREVPTDKAGLMEFLTFFNVRCIQPAAATVIEVAPQARPPAPQEPVVNGCATTVPGDLDALFLAAPLRKQLTLAVQAIDAADAQLHPA